MFCKNCGKTLNQGEMFCSNCGAKVENENNMVGGNTLNQNVSNPTISNVNNLDNNVNVNQQSFNQSFLDNNNNIQVNTFNNSTNPKTSTWKNTTSLIIGITSLILVFIFQVFTMPLSIVGIVFGAMSLKNNKKHKVGLILNIISFVIAIPIFLLYYNILQSTPANPTVGTWDCKAFNNGDNEDLEYIITMKINNDNQFKWNKYNDAKNNYVVGTYEFEDLHKTNNNGTASYYSLILTGDEFVSEGELQTEPYKSQYEMGIIRNSNEAILMNIYSYNMYYCYRTDTSIPKIEKIYSNEYNSNTENNIRINKLTYTLPSNLSEGGMNTETYKSYNYMSSNAYCKFRVNVYDLYNPLTTQKYFEDYVYDESKDLSKLYTKNINGVEWTMLDVDGEYSKNKYGVYIDDTNAYGIEFSITEDNNNECQNLSNKIINSLRIN